MSHRHMMDRRVRVVLGELHTHAPERYFHYRNKFKRADDDRTAAALCDLAEMDVRAIKTKTFAAPKVQCQKMPFDSRAEASDYIRKHRPDSGSLWPYACDRAGCEKWHMTSMHPTRQRHRADRVTS